MDICTFNNCAYVTKKWNHLVKNYIGFDMFIPEKLSIKYLSTLRVRWLWLSDCKYNTGNRDYPKPRYPEVTKFLRLFGTISLQNYNILVGDFANLRQLEIGWLNLRVIGNPLAWHHFPKLTSLKLCGPEPTMIDDGTYSYSIALGYFSGMIEGLRKMHFPKLKVFELESIYHDSRENIFLDTFINFLSRHQKTLRTLSLAFACNTYIDIKAHQSQDVFQDWITIPNFEDRLSKLTLNLKSLFVHFFPFRKAEKLFTIIDHINNTQTSIESSIVLCLRFPTFTSDLVEDNYRTLTAVSLSMWIFEEFDCQVLEKCTLLKKLLLSARPKKLEEFETENYRGIPAKSELVQIDCLPKSLEFIQIINFFIETKDVALFTTNFPRLHTLNLQGIGEKESLGFTLEMFCFLAHKRFKEVGIYRGFNKKLMMKSKESQEGAMVFMSIAILALEDIADEFNILSLGVKYYEEDEDHDEQHCFGACPRYILHNELSPDTRVMFRGPKERGNFYKVFESQVD